MVQNKPTPHKYSPERYKTDPHHTNTVLKKSVSSTMWDRGCGWYKKSFNSTKQFHLWSAIIGTQYNFRPVLVVMKMVLCGSSCIWIDLKTVQMVQNKPTPHKYRPERYKTNPHHTYTVLKKSVSSTMWDPRLGKPPHHDTPCGLPMHGMHGGVWNTDGCTEASRPSKTIARRSGILQRCVCFRTFVICFIPFAFVSYPNELFSYLVQHFHTILV